MSPNDQQQLGHELAEKAEGAFIGAAVGDALGWPQENRSGRVDGSGPNQPALISDSFQRWVRRSGGRFHSHQDVILPGEYSDDTQLLLCTARSLMQGSRWWQHFTSRELPTWTLYERGGGGATKRAADSWLAGRAPWSSDSKAEERKKYFRAGGNGVAMRILPHCTAAAGLDDFNTIAHQILLNGICTHGHPRALVGALAYAYATWYVLRQKTTLSYGHLIDSVVSGLSVWSILPPIEDICPGWRSAADELIGGRYLQEWDTTVEEMVRLMGVCKEAMKRGALSVDREVLTQIGCFDRSIYGAGTVSAAAAIFLASRYAADPIHGLLEAAFAIGADTDTIASMTGCLLGAIGGTIWLRSYAEQVQDSRYLRELAAQVTSVDGFTDAIENSTRWSVRKSDLDGTLARVAASPLGDSIALPDGREGCVLAQNRHTARSDSTSVFSWRIQAADGQTLYLKRITRTAVEKKTAKESQSREGSATHLQRDQPVEAIRLGVKLPVSSMSKARAFYGDAVGLKIVHETESSVNLAGLLALVHQDYRAQHLESGSHQLSKAALRGPIISIETQSLDQAYENVRRSGANILIPITPTRRHRFFLCCDFDGNLVEIYESRKSSHREPKVDEGPKEDRSQ
jgi:ADP-ribosylglycohydrolase/predicted enzyme related to lactoylglutathione lyase